LNKRLVCWARKYKRKLCGMDGSNGGIVLLRIIKDEWRNMAWMRRRMIEIDGKGRRVLC